MDVVRVDWYHAELQGSFPRGTPKPRPPPRPTLSVIAGRELYIEPILRLRITIFIIAIIALPVCYPRFARPNLSRTYTTALQLHYPVCPHEVGFFTIKPYEKEIAVFYSYTVG